MNRSLKRFDEAMQRAVAELDRQEREAATRRQSVANLAAIAPRAGAELAREILDRDAHCVLFLSAADRAYYEGLVSGAAADFPPQGEQL